MSRQDLQERLAQAGFRLEKSELVPWYGQDDEDEDEDGRGARVFFLLPKSGLLSSFLRMLGAVGGIVPFD